jgi:hypothetical protein
VLDGYGDEYNDELTDFLEAYMGGDYKLCIPVDDTPVFFVEEITGIVIDRYEDFQVQLFTCAPNSFIPQHQHPNVDSYEIGIWGMEFEIDGRPANTDKDLPSPVRVKPSSPHGGRAGPHGGLFLSIQQWLNGVKPTSVGNDWIGDGTMGGDHDSQITTDKVCEKKTN